MWFRSNRKRQTEEKMSFRKGQKVEVFRRSADEMWENYMDKFIGRHGIITDPDTSINDPDALVEVSLDGIGTYRLPQDCLRLLPAND
jgi:hypothetical protein